MNEVTELALKWHSEGQDDSQVLDNVTDDVLQWLVDKCGIDIRGIELAKIEMLLRSIIDDNIDWDALEEADQEARDYRDAMDSARWS